MKIILTIEERDYLLKLLGDKNSTLKSKLLKNPRKRKESSYKKCLQKEKKIKYGLLIDKIYCIGV